MFKSFFTNIVSRAYASTIVHRRARAEDTIAQHASGLAGRLYRCSATNSQLNGSFRPEADIQDTEDYLKDFDQDHYGGIAALERLAEEAGITRTQHVLDICSGMDGPARYLARKAARQVIRRS